MAIYLFWISLFSSLYNMYFQECNWIFKETVSFSSGKEPFVFLVWKKAVLNFVKLEPLTP